MKWTRSTLLLLAILLSPGGPAECQESTWTVGFASGWIGIGVDFLTELGTEKPRTEAVINEVVEGSPAERAGLRPEDLIVEVDGRSMSDVGELQRLMVADSIGRPLAARVIRGDRTLTVEIVPVELVS